MNNDNLNDPEDRDARDDLREIDPDWDDVPLDLAVMDGQQVWVDGAPATMVVIPGFHADSRRRREGFYDTVGDR